MARPKPRDIDLTFPELLDDVYPLMHAIRELSPKQLQRVMHISPKLAESTWELIH